MRKFDTGATRDSEGSKPDYEGFLSPLVLQRFAAYMHKHRVLPDGSLRGSDNWQRGIPREVYIKSAFRHFVALWSAHRGHKTEEDIETSLCALLFNVQGYLHELLRDIPGHEGEPGPVKNTGFGPEAGLNRPAEWADRVIECPYCYDVGSGECCPGRIGEYFCSRREGHEGPHVACAPGMGMHIISSCP